MKRILVLNPNSSIAMTQSIDRSIEALRFSGGPRVDVDRLAGSPEGIETQADVESVVVPVVRRIEQEEANAFVIACFSDPGLHMARESVTQPVIGIAESAYAFALTLGTRIGIVSIGERSLNRHARYLRELGLSERVGGDRPINTGTAGLSDSDTLDRIISVAKQLRDTDGADVIVLGCAGMGNYRPAIQRELDLPVVDPVQAAVVAAIGKASLGYEMRPRPSHA